MVDQYFGNDSLEPFECIFLALLALFFYLMEVPTMRPPDVKMLLCWLSRMQILEQFDESIERKVTERSEEANILTTEQSE